MTVSSLNQVGLVSVYANFLLTIMSISRLKVCGGGGGGVVWGGGPDQVSGSALVKLNKKALLSE